MKIFDIAAARSFQKQKQALRAEKLKMRYITAQNAFERIVQMLIENYKPKRIYQWGSLLDKAHFSEISDIDIAVEGIKDAGAYFQLLAEAGEITDLPLDIVEMESIHILHKEMIMSKGKLIYERD